MQLKEICSHLADDMAREGLRGKTLTLKLKSAATFEVRRLSCKFITYMTAIECPTNSGLGSLSIRLAGQHTTARLENICSNYNVN